MPNQVVDRTARPAGRRLTVEQVVAHLERLAERPAERAQRGALRVPPSAKAAPISSGPSTV